MKDPPGTAAECEHGPSCSPSWHLTASGRHGELLELLTTAKIREALVVTHMGHENERARGDSRNLDWPDVNWTLVRESVDPASKRFIKAFGRGVDVPETAREFNPATHRLSIGRGSRRDMQLKEVIVAVLEFVGNSATPPSQTEIRKALEN